MDQLEALFYVISSLFEIVYYFVCVNDTKGYDENNEELSILETNVKKRNQDQRLVGLDYLDLTNFF